MASRKCDWVNRNNTREAECNPMDEAVDSVVLYACDVGSDVELLDDVDVS